MKERMKRLINILASIPTDKLLHFVVGTFIASFFALIVPTGRLWCIAPVILVALAKEIYDKIDYGRFDWVDLAYTVAGGLIIQVFALL